MKDRKRADFNNRVFWDNRYETDPALGSGIGSRGECMSYKQVMLKEAFEQVRPRTVLDIGCGDMAISSVFPAEGYIGIDTSNVIIQKNKEAYPERSFVWGDFLELDLPPSEMVICLDVLIHLGQKNNYREFVKKIVRQATRYGIIAGYEADPGAKGIVFYHEPVSKTLRACGVTRFRKIGEYNKTTVIMFEAPLDESGSINLLGGLKNWFKKI